MITVDNKVLSHELHQQDTYYFCGPASTRTALSAHGIYEGEWTLAAKLPTTVNGTDHISQIARVLNDYLPGSPYTTKNVPTGNAQEADVLKNDVYKSIMAGFVVVANVIGTASSVDGRFLSYTGGHYFPVVGFRNGGHQVLVSDVAIGVEYWMHTAALAAFITPKGYAYANIDPPPPPAPPQEGLYIG